MDIITESLLSLHLAIILVVDIIGVSSIPEKAFAWPNVLSILYQPSLGWQLELSLQSLHVFVTAHLDLCSAIAVITQLHVLLMPVSALQCGSAEFQQHSGLYAACLRGIIVISLQSLSGCSASFEEADPASGIPCCRVLFTLPSLNTALLHSLT